MAKKHDPASTVVVDTAKAEVRVDHLAGRSVKDDDQPERVSTEAPTGDGTHEADQVDRPSVTEVLADDQLPDGGPPDDGTDDGTGLTGSAFASLRDQGLTSALDRLTDLDPFGSPGDAAGGSGPSYGKDMIMDGKGTGTTSFVGAPVAVGSDDNFKIIDTGIGGHGGFGGSNDIFGSSRQDELQQAEIEINSNSRGTAPEHKDTDFLPTVTDSDLKATEEKALAPDDTPTDDTVDAQYTDDAGNVVTVYHDGTITTLHPDGTMDYDDGDVTVTEHPDGTVDVVDDPPPPPKDDSDDDTDPDSGDPPVDPDGSTTSIPDEDHQVVLPPAIEQFMQQQIAELRALHPDTGPGDVDGNPDADQNFTSDIRSGPVPDAHAEIAGALTNPGSPDNPNFDGPGAGGTLPSGPADPGNIDPGPDSDALPQTDGPNEREHQQPKASGVHSSTDDDSDEPQDDDGSAALTPVDHVPDAFDHVPDHLAFNDDDTPSQFEPIEPVHEDLVPDHLGRDLDD